LSLDHFAAQLEIKQVSEQRIITGFAAAGGLDRVGDIIDMSTAFRKTLSEKSPSDVAVFIGHDTSALPVGIPISIEATPQGLKTETKIFDGPAGDNLLAVAKGLRAAGQTLGLSIGYRVTDSTPERVNGKLVRKLTGIDLVEYSFAARQSIANPRALVTGVKAGAGMSMTVEQQDDGKYHVMKGSQSMGAYDSEAAANQAVRMMMAGGGKTDVNDLPDSAFLFIASGGVLDEGAKTVPRTKRHFPYRDEAGGLDRAALAGALAAIPGAKTLGLDNDEVGRLYARARRLHDLIPNDHKTADDAPEWQSGVPLDLLAAGYRLIDLAERLVAAAQGARGDRRNDVKGGQRMRPRNARRS
jgi:HK97 family phage prohead protease